MTSISHKPDSRLPTPRLSTSWLVTAITLGVTVAAVYYAAEVAETKDRDRFGNLVARSENDIRNRLSTYVDLLRASSSFASVAGPIDQARFERFVAGLDLQGHYPGIQGIAFAQRVEHRLLDSFRLAVRRQGFDSFDIRPPGVRPEYAPVVYLAPLDRRNRAAIGFDMYSEPVRREAMDRARDSARPAASGKLTLQQEIDSGKQAGFIIYLPLYRGGVIPRTVEERRLALEAFITAPFRADDLLAGIFGRVSPHVDLRVYDGPEATAEALMHDTHRLDADREERDNVEPRFTAEQRIEVEGRIWTLRFGSGPEFERTSGRGVVAPLLIGGILVTLVIFALTRAQEMARRAAERSAIERGISEQELQASQARLSAIFNQMAVGFCEVDLEGRFVRVNRRLCEMLDYSDEHLIGRTFIDITDPADRDQSSLIFSRTVADGASFSLENRYLRSDGSYLWANVTASIVRSEQGNPLFSVAVIQDISRRKRFEEDLHNAKEVAEAASQAKDRFLAVLSHELRTPLTPVLTALDLLEADDTVPEHLATILSIVKRNVELEAHLIDDMLDLTRIANGKLQLNMTTLDIHEILPQALQMSQAEADRKKLKIHFQLFARHHRITGDAARLQQVFWNLLSNAVKFTPDAGTITIRSFNTRDGALQIEVEDNGMGIEPELLPKIFNAFEQGANVAMRNFGGLGLGLAITRMLVGMHGGDLVAESDGPGHGAVFRVLLPHAIDVDGKSNAGSRAGAKILIVEDHADTSRIMKMLLDRSGYQVHIAASVAGALELAEREKFDLLISDIGLPDGNGLDLMRTLNQRAPVRGIAMSGYSGPDDLQRSRDAGYEAHMVKPVNLKELYDAIHQALEERESGGRVAES